jgi:hypothetical protein
LALQNGCDRVEGVATLELHGEGMFGQCDTRRLLISLHGRLKKRVKTCGSCLLSHIKSKDNMGALEGGLVRSWAIFANEICKQVPDSLAQELFFVLSALSRKYF